MTSRRERYEMSQRSVRAGAGIGKIELVDNVERYIKHQRQISQWFTTALAHLKNQGSMSTLKGGGKSHDMARALAAKIESLLSSEMPKITAQLQKELRDLDKLQD